MLSRHRAIMSSLPRFGEVAMLRKNVLVIGVVVVIFGALLVLSLGETLARPSTQDTAQWEEGRQVGPSLTQDAGPVLAVATTPGTYYRTFSGASFQPTGSALTYAPIGGAIYATAIPAGGYSFSLDFSLPPGATITELVFFVVDNDATNMDLSLRSYNPETDTFTALESAASSGASTALQTITIPIDPKIQVDNSTTSYRLRVAPGVATSGHLLRGARVGYTLAASYMPLLSR